MICGILILQSGIEPLPPAEGAQNLNYWTASEVPLSLCYKYFILICHFSHLFMTSFVIKQIFSFITQIVSVLSFMVYF